MSTFDRKTFANLCRDFIDAATPAIHDRLEYPQERETQGQALANLRFIFKAAVPYFARDSWYELAVLLGPARYRERNMQRQDHVAFTFAEIIAGRLLEDHGSYAINLMLPKELVSLEGASTALFYGLPNLKQVITNPLRFGTL